LTNLLPLRKVSELCARRLRRSIAAAEESARDFSMRELMVSLASSERIRAPNLPSVLLLLLLMRFKESSPNIAAFLRKNQHLQTHA